MRRPRLECTVLTGWNEPQMKTPIACSANAHQLALPYELPVCDKHVKENGEHTLTLTFYPPRSTEASLVGLAKGSRFKRR